MESWRLLPVGAALGLFIGGAWTYLVYMDWGMRHMDVGMDMWIMPQMANWDATDLGLVLLMWAVMMAAMMLPSVLPVRSRTAETRRRLGHESPMRRKPHAHKQKNTIDLSRKI
jgi:predicted metal-binding membrane protein